MKDKKSYPIDGIMSKFVKIINEDRTAGIMLGVAVILAMIIANSPLSEYYFNILDYSLGIQFNGKIYFDFTLLEWINNGLMSVFFFVVGLELKREIIDGELSHPRQAILPIFAAIGGMVVPLSIYLLLNPTGDASHGWGIPMATDIAFAIGVLYFLGDRVPLSLKVFLTALAIIDDMGAVAVIAFFYTSDLNTTALLIGFAVLGVIIFINWLGVRNTLVYALLGIFGVWVAFLESGVSATIASVLVAFTIPADMRVDKFAYALRLRQTVDNFVKSKDKKNTILSDEKLAFIKEIRGYTNFVTPPLQRLEESFHFIVAFFIVPLFALANAGVDLRMDMSALFTTNILAGVGLGLFVGKLVGVTFFTWILIKLKIAVYPDGMNLTNLVGVSLLASIGFTMSLFITNLAFTNEEYIIQAKVGIFIASIIGGLAGYYILKKSNEQPELLEQVKEK